MWWRRRSRNAELITAALLDLNARVATIEQALVIIVDYLDVQRKPRVAKVIWPADTQAVH
jgi:hypothetical protein